jgi:hypothetical protein
MTADIEGMESQMLAGCGKHPSGVTGLSRYRTVEDPLQIKG